MARRKPSTELSTSSATHRHCARLISPSIIRIRGSGSRSNCVAGLCRVGTLITVPEDSQKRSRHDPSEVDRHGVSYLTRNAIPCSEEHVVIGECLQPRSLPEREVSDSTIGLNEGILATGHAVDPSLNSLRGPVEAAPRMALVPAGTRYSPVVHSILGCGPRHLW